MRKPMRIRKKKQILKGECENNLDESKNDLDLIPNNAVDNPSEKSNKCSKRNVLKDQTNVIRRDQSPVINTPSTTYSLKYGLRRNNSVDYKKLANGLHYGCNENKADLNTINPVTPKPSNKIFKSVSDCKITADFESNANSEVTPALKNSKPIYNIHINTPRPRQSMPIENKLAVYEFEVDENEPKVKQKKKRVRKVGEKKKLKKEQNKRIVAKNVVTSLQNCKKDPVVRLVRLGDEKKVLSTQNSSYLRNRTPVHNSVEYDSQPAQEKNLSRASFEVPVLFHNHQDATPVKKKASVTKPGFSEMSDDEEMGKSQKRQLDISLFSKAKRSLDVKEKTLRSSFSNDYSYDYQINASTPVKCNQYNTTGNSSSIENCFGFDEPEAFEEPLLSPIKNPAEDVSNHSGQTVPTPHRFYQKQDDNCEKQEEIPVTQVIKMLKYGTDDDNLEIKSRSSSSSVSPIFKDPVVEDDKLTNITLTEKKIERSVKPVPRRSYERPSFLRKKNKSFEEEDSGGESDVDKKKKTFLSKKKHGPTRKEKKEMEEWINAFNSQCQEVEKYNLVVE